MANLPFGSKVAPLGDNAMNMRRQFNHGPLSHGSLATLLDAHVPRLAANS